MAQLDVTEFTDPGCPWAYSASPAFAVLQWRYREQLRLADRGDRPDRDARALRRRGLHARADGRRQPALPPLRDAVRGGSPRARGRHLARLPRDRRHAPARPPREREVLRALQFAWFTTPLLLDEDDGIRGRPRGRGRGSTSTRSSRRSTAPETLAAYERDKPDARTRRGRGHPLPGQGAPDRRPGALLGALAGLRGAGRRARMEAGGFQPVEAYDVVIANLDPASSATRRREDAARGAARASPRASSRRRSRRSWRRTTCRPTATPPSARWSSCSPRERVPPPGARRRRAVAAGMRLRASG